jgi:hypothetical protein
MARHWLVRLPLQEDDEQGQVLVRVTSRETYDLDLDFLATEGQNVFKGKLRRNDLKSLRAKAYNGTEDEWEAILQYALLERKLSAISKAQKQSLEVGASRQDQKGKLILSITFRNRIDDMTQRIGAIELSHTSKEIQLFDWAVLAVNRASALENELSTLSGSTDEDKASIARLESQLADLVEAKADHEEQLLLKFTLLLNDKKAKIRDQQRLIQTSTLDDGRGRELRALQKSGSSRNTTRRTGKRPAQDDDDSEADESQAFETQEDRRGRTKDDVQELDSDRQTTPSSTGSEGDDQDGEMPIRARKPSPRKASPKPAKKSAPSSARRPPSRASPVAAKSGHNTRSETQPMIKEPTSIDDDEETASEDDEL